MATRGRLLVRGGRVVDPAAGLDGVADVLVDGDRVAAVGPNLLASAGDAVVVEAAGRLVTPGLVDMHVHLREPGKEDEETIASGATAAVAGGLTSVACFPNTEPAIDNEGSAEFVVLQGKRAAMANVFPVGAVTLDLAGERLSEMAGLARAGAVAFSDADRSVESAEIFRRALLYARMLGRVVISHCEDRHLRADGVIHQGMVSLRLGLAGIPTAAEEIMVARDIALARLCDARLHISQTSTANSVEQLRLAKAEGIAVTGDVTPHHLTLTDTAVSTFDATYKMIPPLRSEDHVEALIEGLRDGAIDIIVSGHAPHADEEKAVEFDHAPFGVIGMETLFPVVYTELVGRRGFSASDLIAKLTVNPARILGLFPDRGTLRPGSFADISVFDVDTEWEIDGHRFFSRSRNCPFVGQRVRGRAMDVVVGGRHVVVDGQPVGGVAAGSS